MSKMVKIENLVWIAPSHLTESVESIEKCCNTGAGAIILKMTDGRLSRACNRSCSQCKLDSSFGGRKMFIDNQTIYSFTPNSSMCEFLSLEEIRNLVDYLKKNYANVFRISSICAKNQNEFIKTSKILEKYGVHALEMNIKYTIRYSDSDIADAKEYILSFVKEVSKKINLPLLLKLSPDHRFLNENFIESISGYVEGLTVSDSISGVLPTEFKRKLPKEINKDSCGIVGDPLWGVVSKWIPIAKCYSDFVSASGGIINSERVKKIIELGADSIQLCTGIEVYGYKLIKDISDSLKI